MLQLIDVKKIYKTKAGDVAALDGVSLTFPETGMVFITGKSGSGKTTMLNVIGGLDGIDGGEILVYGKKFSEFTTSEYDSYRNTLIGFIFQEYNLLPDYTIEKNVGIADELQGKKTDKEELERVLASVGIESFEGRKPGQLSGGQKQRVAIARALIKNPKIIMADEPTGALDSATGIQVVEELKRLSKEKLIIVISHDLELAKKYADRIIRLVDGKVVEDVTIEENEITSNVLETQDAVTVKTGSDLTQEEKDVLAKAVKENRSIVLTAKPTVKVKKPTDESTIKVSDEKVKLIKSKMKLKSSAMLGIKSLKVKPLRLIFTILLSAIAFAVFGVFDTIASYSRNRVVADFLVNGDFTSISVNAKEKTDDGESYNLNLNEETINVIKDQTGYNFKPIYGVQPFVSNVVTKPANETLYEIKSSKGKIENSSKGKGKGYYVTKISGIVEFKESERNERSGITEYGYNLIWGEYPTLEYNDDEVVKESVYKVAISKYLADCIAYQASDRNGNPTTKLFGKTITVVNNDYSDFEGVKIMPYNVTMASGVPEFEIVGIYDTGAIPSKFDMLKECYVKANNDPNQQLIDELKAYVASGAHQLLFVAEGAIEESAKLLKRPVAYFLPPAKYDIKNDKVGGQSNAPVNLNEVFYTPESATKSQVCMFDPDREKLEDYTLADDEILIYYRNLDFIFAREYGLTYVIPPYLKSGNEELNNLIDGLNSMVANPTVFKAQVATAVWLANELRFFGQPAFNPDTATPEQKDARYTRKITLTKTSLSTGESIVKEYKVVGVYFGVSTTFYAKELAPLLGNKNTLSGLGVSLRQGQYTRLMSLMKTSSKTGIELANYITATEGLTLNLYGNNVLNTLEKSETQILQFTNLFLYASLILALFSMFMLFNYISTSINSKRNSIGVLRALGSNSSDVFKMFLTESLIISLISGILACGVSFYACELVNFYIRDIMSLMVNFAIYGIRQVIIILAIAIVTSIMASIAPIIKIAREKPVDLIRRP